MDQQTGPNPLPMLAQAIAEAERIVGNVRPDQWALMTPCTEWNVRDVVNHLVGGNAMNLAAMNDGAAGFPSGDYLGDDPAGTLAASNRAILDRLGQPGALQAMVPLPYGTMPGHVVAGFRMIDILSHAWDIAKATGQPTDFAPDLNATALAICRERMAGFDRTNNPVFGPEQPCPEGAPAADQLAAFLGRVV